VPIEIHPYNRGWPKRYLRLARDIDSALGPGAHRVEHIGSTAIPGLAAKDIIDIQVSVAAFEPEANYREPLERIGYTYRADAANPDHRFFKQDGPTGRRLVNLHVCEVGSAWERRHLLFRNLLRSNPRASKQYELLKVRLSAMYEDVLSYTDAKSAFIEEILAASPPTHTESS